MSEKLFPIFDKNFNANDHKATELTALNKRPKEWIPIGNQYQLDVGQKEFGLRTCKQCNMQYSVHEPEDELLHLKYHNSIDILTFKGWHNERVVTQIPEWDSNDYGRIICVCDTDSKVKKDRIKQILDMVDRDLGFAARTEIKEKTLVRFISCVINEKKKKKFVFIFFVPSVQCCFFFFQRKLFCIF